VTRIDDENISMPLKASTEESHAYLNGIAKLENRVVLLLDTDKILDNEKVHSIA
jgi:chemotaxis signal transduction protein